MTRLVRFSPSERTFHWVFALGYLALLASGLPLMFPGLRALIRGYTPLIGLRLHLAWAVLWVIAVLAVVLLANRRLLARAGRDLTTFEVADAVWLRRFPRWLVGGAGVRARIDGEVGRFNAGQKLNAIFTAVTAALLLISGLALIPLGDAPLAAFLTGSPSVAYWQTIHRWLTLLILLPLAGHIFLAVVFPPTRHSLSGMLGGRVDAGWAAAHHPRWGRAIPFPSAPPIAWSDASFEGGIEMLSGHRLARYTRSCQRYCGTAPWFSLTLSNRVSMVAFLRPSMQLATKLWARICLKADTGGSASD